MKRLKTILICGIVGVILCACASSNEPIPASTEAQMTETQEQITKTQPTEAPEDSTEALTEPAETKFLEALSGGTFFSHSYEKNLTIDEYCASFSAETSVSAAITKCAAVDLDRDQVPEVVLWITVNEYNDYGTVVLRYQNDEVEEYTFAYRQLFDLKVDGTFSFSGGEKDGFALLAFYDDSWEYKEITEEITDPQQGAKKNVDWLSYPCEDYSELFND